jgi:hypothetical protein
VTERRRQYLGIPHHNKTHRVWGVEGIARLGAMADRKIAKEIGRSLTSVQH